ncbi:MAG: gamma-glutamyltransferase [Geminicoccaceae bacterium]|nr:MAG: gamma-glutamyltransferase [Geminicoccaceae bacterium]
MAVFAKTVVAGERGLVVAQSRDAAAIGAAVLEKGGNAIDAAVATSLALGVFEPWMSGIGGGCAALIQPPGEAMPIALDGGMIAARSLDPKAYPLSGGVGGDLFAWPGVVEDRNVSGPLSVAMPGLVAALGLAHARFGRLSWAEVVEPAAAAAEAGHRVDWYSTLIVATAAGELRRQPAAAAAWLANGLPPSPDWRKGVVTIDMENLALTYRRLAAAGADDFYRGELAARWIAEAKAAGTWLEAGDAEHYQAAFVDPLRFDYRGATVSAMDGLFAGRSLRATLERLAERWPGTALDAEGYAAIAEALRTAYGERLVRMGHAAELGNTTHFCVADADGMVVSWTQTLLSLFGSKVLLPETGILLNNGVMWFDPRPGQPNALAPGAKPLANMCPALLELKDGRRVALGACGGRRILPAVAQLSSFLVDQGDDLATAFARPRVDVSGGDVAIVDARLDQPIQEAIARVMPIETVAEAIYPPHFAIPSALSLELGTAFAEGVTTKGISASCHPWADAVAAGGQL